MFSLRVPSLGRGGSTATCTRHSNLPCLMAGKLGGQFETGRHVAYKLDTPIPEHAVLELVDAEEEEGGETE